METLILHHSSLMSSTEDKSKGSDQPPSTHAPQSFTRFHLPGFGLPLNFTPYKGYDTQKWNGKREEYEPIHVESAGEGVKLMPNALNSRDLKGGSASLRLTTLRELAMIHLMNQLTDKPGWDEKESQRLITHVFDRSITAKWTAEAMATPDQDITPGMINWCFAELQWKAEVFRKTGALSVYTADVVKSDSTVPELLKNALKEAVKPLEDVLDIHKDWHPGSDEKVLDLVHPSLFPLVYGRTRILPDSVTSLDDCIVRCGEGVVVPVPSREGGDPDRWDGYSIKPPVVPGPYSRKFQWLPCDIDISGEENSVKITSYINNLHPEKHRGLYTLVEQLIACAIPLWNMTLTPLKKPACRFHRINYEYVVYRGKGRHRKVVQPDIGFFRPPAPQTLNAPVDLRKDYAHRGLQVIVKFANIHLTPEKPEYEGGSWHVEGQLNEHICATALYYYDSDNITPSSLSFRHQVDDASAHSATNYDQNDHGWFQAIFGCQNEEAAVQFLGSVETREGRLLTFPNILQHQVQPFALADRTRPGHRKVVALFLVDPGIRIVSTANVPCQQREWWAEKIRMEKGPLGELPVELRDKVIDNVEDFPITLREAKEMRLDLMAERKVFVKSHGDEFLDYAFSLCEH